MDKTIYKYEYNKNKKRKLFRILLIISIVSFITGIFYVAVISKNDKILIENSFNEFFKSIASNSLNSVSSLIDNILANIVLTAIVWILGISVIGVPISIIYLIFKSFVLGFSISSLIYTYGIKAVIPTFIYSFPLIINLGIIFILTFYAVNLSKKIYLFFFKKKNIDFKKMINTYLKLLVISMIILLISAIISSYLVPILIKVFTNGLI